ncbi:MAG TPA: IS1182 family transposase [Vicinamibacterales bacterium]|nr:IS1182 family transposase [Vicinamibacterales bacterium]
MAKTYRPYVPEQDLLLPPSLRDWLPEDHLAFFVSDLIDHVDLSAITAVYEDEERGYPPYHPVMLTKVLVYAYCVGVFSSRKIQRRLIEDIAFRVLAAGNEPDFRTIADFRKRHLSALQGFFEQVLDVARDLGTLRVGRIALDGSKVKANASKHKAMSYGRMKEKEKQLRDEVTHLLAQAEATDAAEDAQYGADVRGDELPAELQRRESRLKRIREATRALKARAKEEAVAKGEPAEAAKPDPKAQYNFTDPESRIMKGPDGFVQAYNVQVAVNEQQLIVGQAVTQETNDKKQLIPMITIIEEQSGATPTQLLADAGYCSDANLAAVADTPIDAYISTRKQKHGERPGRPGPCPRGPLPTTATRVDRMSRKLHTKAGAAVYAMRKAIVEPVIGQIKQARGFRQFLLRGIEKVQGEWSLVCTTHNILKLYRLYG